MPTSLRVKLETDNRTMKGRSERIIDVLSKLCDQDESVETAYLCHPAVQLISKSRKEGNLCGYRNIQMMISYITSSNVQDSQQFADGVPSVLRLQDLIEDAWDKGVNSEGRFETGGIRGTRKYIGTPEVCSKISRRYQCVAFEITVSWKMSKSCYSFPNPLPQIVYPTLWRC